MPGMESGLINMLGLWFLLVTFFITIAVAIKVLLGGKSGSEPERHDSPPDSTKARHKHAAIDKEGLVRRKSGPDR